VVQDKHYKRKRFDVFTVLPFRHLCRMPAVQDAFGSSNEIAHGALKKPCFITLISNNGRTSLFCQKNKDRSFIDKKDTHRSSGDDSMS
jgi:hypothetical protein